MSKNILIIGAGVIGASIAYRMTQARARVTIVDRAGPAAGASGSSFGWLNASFYADADHHRLRVAGLEAYHRLAADLPEAAISWQSTLWFERQGAGMDDMAQALAALGYPCDRIGRDAILGHAPALAAPDAALHFSAEGVVDGATVTRALLAAAGARLITGVAVQTLLRRDGQVVGVSTDVGDIRADHVIVAAGVGAEALIGFPMLRRPGLLLKTNVLPRVLHHVLITPEGEVKQDAEGRLVMPTAASHQADDSESVPDSPDVLADAALVRLQSLFPDVPLSWSHVSVAQRPVPQDGLPVIGAVGPGLYTAVMHSGMTLAAITGEMVAQEVMGDTLVNTLGPYRPQRFGL